MRIKFSVARHARKKKVLKRASGYYGDKSRRLRMATQQLDHSGVHAYVDRKDKKTTYQPKEKPMAFDMSNYVDVATRIKLLIEQKKIKNTKKRGRGNV